MFCLQLMFVIFISLPASNVFIKKDMSTNHENNVDHQQQQRGSRVENGKEKKAQNVSALSHLLAGGIGSTVAQFVTNPLDVVQTRLMSTKLNFSSYSKGGGNSFNVATTGGGVQIQSKPVIGFNYFQVLAAYMRHMVNSEGIRSLYKGLAPGLIGIVPAKSAYFFCYASAKTKLNQNSTFQSHQHVVHSLSAMMAGLFTGTVTNPVWYIKTKLQLNVKDRTSVTDIVRKGYKKHGFKCFFRGISASYVGVFETVIYFLLYEELKRNIQINNTSKNTNNKFQALHLMYAAMLSKITATTIMYPHEVIRTRLRQDVLDQSGTLKYKNFVQSLMLVGKEEGRVGLYGGFGTSLLRQLPNTAVTFLTYEAIIHYLDQ